MTRSTTSPAPERIPVVVATGQATEHDIVVTPIEMARRAAEAALSQVPALRARVDRLSMVNILSGAGPAPASRLARDLGLVGTRCEVSTIGGNSPQWLINRSAAAIASGEAGTVLVAGAEAQRSRRIRRAEERARGDHGTRNEEPAPAADPMVGDERPGAGPAELAAGLVAPVHTYALFESALAQRAGRSFAEQREVLGRLMAPFTEVAAAHPCAWFPRARSAHELSEISADNRLVSEPYSKRMCAVMQVDQGASVVVTSLAAARAAGVAERAVFCWSGADVSDVWFPTARPDLASSPGIAAAGAAAFEACGIGLDDVSLIDLYSCFPSAVQMAASALGIEDGDPRSLTVTGGLPYFGGPGNDYTLHAIATMVERLLERGGIGLVTGLGWYATKHSVGVYGSQPPAAGWRQADTAGAQEAIDSSAVTVVEASELSSEMAGPGSGLVLSVVGATVAIDREGRVSAAPVIGRLPDGRQTAVAAAEEDLAGLAGTNLAGTQVIVRGSPPRYRVPG